MNEADSTQTDRIPLQVSLEPVKWNAALFDEIVDLLAEALVLDFQAGRKVMAESPQGFGRN